ncbi:MAG: glycosyltransferase family 39 protein, partial [Anaerolineales bacterium]|nr:glycosyltransferase family 39 protein [Anaerolineales bacterium]
MSGFNKINWLLIAVVTLGLGLRLWGIGFGLPYLYHPDEGVPVQIALQILRTGDFNPHFFHWSSLLFYANALVYGMYFVLGRLTGKFVSPSDLPVPDIITIAVGKTALPEEFLLSRGLTAVVGALSIIGVYLICRRMSGNKTAGWIAALFLAVEPLDVSLSHYIRPDTFVVFFGLLTVYFSLKIVFDPRVANYILAGICAGLAASFKYNAALVCVSILTAHLFYFGIRGLTRKEIYLAAGISLAVFLVTTP